MAVYCRYQMLYELSRSEIILTHAMVVISCSYHRCHQYILQFTYTAVWVVSYVVVLFHVWIEQKSSWKRQLYVGRDHSQLYHCCTKRKECPINFLYKILDMITDSHTLRNSSADHQQFCSECRVESRLLLLLLLLCVVSYAS